MLSGNPANPTASLPEGRADGPAPFQGAGGDGDDSGPARVMIRVSEDKLQAFISIHPPVKAAAGDLGADFIQRRWRDQGLDAEALSHDSAQSLADAWNSTRALVEERLAAEAVNPPVRGADARIENLLETSMKSNPAEEGAAVDFRNLNLIKPVKQGQPLARKIPAQLGIHGIDLYGQPAPAADGNDIEIPKGLNTEISGTDPNVLLASVAGFLQPKDGLIGVSECFVVDGSVDFSTGNIAYEQSSVIRGDISDGFTVNVGGALEVGGGVGEAKLLVGGDVLIRKGFVGSGHGLITAKGGITLGFSSNQTLRAHGDVILEKESFNCQIYSRKSISVHGPLVGGLTMALRSIQCRVAGNDLGTKTELEAGMDYILHENKLLLEEKVKELTGHLAKINQKLKAFREIYRTRKRFSASEAKVMLELRDMQEKIQARLPEMEKRKLAIAEQIRQGYQQQGLCVKVEKKVNPGVVIRVGSDVFRVQEEMSGPKVFLFQAGRIKVV
jgi:uncharacterized protein (DUF342 family)